MEREGENKEKTRKEGRVNKQKVSKRNKKRVCLTTYIKTVDDDCDDKMSVQSSG